MKSVKYLFLLLVLSAVSFLQAQVTTDPAVIPFGYTGSIVFTFDPSQGTGGMKSATECYSHMGLITDKSKDITDWKYVIYGDKWGTNQEPAWTKSGDKWTLTINNLYDFYGVPASENIVAIVMVFHNGQGNSSLEGKSTATSNGDILIYLGKENKESIWDNFVFAPVVEQARPAGVFNGIYYSPDGTSVTLCTFAAGNKTAGDNSVLEPAKHVCLIGDMTGWELSNDYQMKRDGNYFWITIPIEKGREYRFQYAVVRADGVKMLISDLFSEKLLTPDDNYEPRWTDPDLISYPMTGAEGYVSVLQSAKTPFNWSSSTTSFQRPDKNNLVIYELWIYDHTPERNLLGLMKRLDYIQNLGVNCVELMPVCEFDGNQSWGYSPNHYFAIDKAYGTPDMLKTFIDECHKRGMAVVLDMVFNHATGNNPMNKLYPYGNDLKFNPCFNVTPPHPDNVYQDWNHDFEPVKDMFRRAVAYWLTEYKVDGYRFDLSHGLCGKTYNAPANIKEYYDVMQTVSPGSYLMLEHWGNSMATDRPNFVQQGMMCWQNTSYVFQQATGAWLEGDGLSDANTDNYVSYFNNHDEERPFFKAKQWGAGDLKKSEASRAARIPLVIGMQCLLDGPQLFYHFDELAFDYSKFQDGEGRFGTDGVKEYGATEAGPETVDYEVKMSTKFRPEPWMAAGPRMQGYQRLAQIIQLRTRLMPGVFSGNPTQSTLTAKAAVKKIQWGSQVFAVGNFSATASQTVTLPSGTWYDYLDGGQQAASSYTLQPNEIKVFTGSYVAAPAVPDHYEDSTPLEYVLPQPVSATRKLLIDGTLMIVREDGSVYSVSGRRIQ
ncbi:MAG: hypothetical protein J6Y00_03905 [Paludibacteraceae bacterium]|nr:hypothetical protein [Paludibacteraceae bacterium]